MGSLRTLVPASSARLSHDAILTMRRITPILLLLSVLTTQVCWAQVSSTPTVKSKASGEEHPVIQNDDYDNILIDGKLRLGKLLEPNSSDEILRVLGPPESKEVRDDVTGRTMEIKYDGMKVYYFEMSKDNYVLSEIIVDGENHFMKVRGREVRPGESEVGDLPFGEKYILKSVASKKNVIEYFVGKESGDKEKKFKRTEEGSIEASDIEFLDVHIKPKTDTVQKIVLTRQIV